MGVNFEMAMVWTDGHVYWFKAKNEYNVRIDADRDTGSCDCTGATFKQSGAKQKDCKHIKKAKKIVKVLKEASKKW